MMHNSIICHARLSGITAITLNKNMGLPSTITLPGPLVFDDVTSLSGSTVIYYAESGNGDIAGRPSLKFSQETTKAGIVRTLASLVIPHWNDGTQKYDSFSKCDSTMYRSDKASVTETEEIYSQMAALLAFNLTVIPVLARGRV